MYGEMIGASNSHACVFIPGGYHTGVCYLQTPDGRSGWAELAAAHEMLGVVTDMPGMGRSGGVPFNTVTSEFILTAYARLIESLPQEVTLFVHSLSGFMGFLLAERLPHKIKRIVAIEPSLIANIQESTEPEIETAEQVNLYYRGFPFELDMRQQGFHSLAMFDRFTRKHTTTHEFPNDEESLRQYEASLQGQHPRLFYELFHVRGSKPSLKDPTRLRNTRVLIVTTEDPLHVHDDVKIVDFLRSYDIQTEHWKEGAHGTRYNGHMLMIEKNNHLIFQEIIEWIEKG